MPQIVEAYGQRLEFPDNMPREQIAQAIKANERSLREKQLMQSDPGQYDPSSAEWKAKNSPTAGMGTGQKLLAGIGSGFASVGRAVGLGGAMSSFGLPATKEEAKAIDAPLMATGAGRAGRMIGTAAPALPAALIPGANTYLGATLIGGGTGFGLTEGGLADRAQGALYGAAGGAAGKGLGDAVGAGAKWLGGRMADGRGAAQVANAQRDAAAIAAQRSGYVIPPADVRGGFLNEMLGGLSGKIKTAQAASAQNQGTTNALARKALGFADDAQLTPDTLQAFRNTAATSGYAPIRQAGEVSADAAYKKSLDSIAGQYQGAARSFPGAAKNPVMDMVESLRQSKFDAGDALDMVKVLRADADKAFRTGDSGMGKAAKAAAGAIEDQIERHLKAAGDDAAMAAFRKARQDIAKSYTLQKAVNVGSGDVSAPALARELAKGKPLSGDLRTIAEIANAFPKATQALKESPKAVSPFDWLFGGSLTAATGNPLALATMAARPMARSLVLSKPYQSAFAIPQSYRPGLLESMLPGLENEMFRRTLPGVGGLLSANAAQ
jgi:hypothetical protein